MKHLIVTTFFIMAYASAYCGNFEGTKSLNIYSLQNVAEKRKLIGKRLFIYPNCNLSPIFKKPSLDYKNERYKSEIPLGFTIKKLITDEGMQLALDSFIGKLGISFFDGYMPIGENTPVDSVQLIKSAQDAIRGKGVLIVDVAPTSVAQRAGILKNDVLIALDGQNVTTQADIYSYVKELKIDQNITFSIIRSNIQHTLATKLLPLNTNLFYEISMDDGLIAYINADKSDFYEKDYISGFTTWRCLSEFTPEQIAADEKQRKDAYEKIKADEVELKAQREAQAKKPGARIGMTTKQVIEQTSWGRPESVNRTINAYGTDEQWVYGGGNYLYFHNGKLYSIQN